MITLTPGDVTLAQLEQIWRGDDQIALHPDTKAPIELAAAFVAKAAAGGAAVYGVNTGFGKAGKCPYCRDQTAILQRNLILSHCCGVGEVLEAATTRMMMVLKLLSLGRGASGVVWATVDLIIGMLNKGVLPQIPVQGSVGASGDLAPLAHMAAVMLGEGEASFQGEAMSGGAALAAAWPIAGGFWPKGGPCLNQWHAIFHCLCAGGIV
jgi:histidine ammonia-lyase